MNKRTCQTVGAKTRVYLCTIGNTTLTHSLPLWTLLDRQNHELAYSRKSNTILFLCGSASIPATIPTS